MDIDTEKWQNSRISQPLQIFNGLLAEKIINNGGPRAVKQANKFLPHIFWRWYFLESEHNPGISPYLELFNIRSIEKWPPKGQFFPQVSLQNANTKKFNVNINVDYISFEEQPLLVDVKQILDQKDPTHQYDKKYLADTKFLASEYLKTSQPIEKFFQTKNLYWLIDFYLNYHLTEWYNDHPLIKEAFTLNSWLFFWHKHLADIKVKEFYNSAEIINDYTKRMRAFFPEYSLTVDEMIDENQMRELDSYEFRIQSFYEFGLKFSYHILLPFSLYLHLLAPVFIENDQFDQDVKDLLTHSFVDPLPIYTICSYLSLTYFGQKIFK